MPSRPGRLLLLVPTESYRIGDFLAAARKGDIDVVVGSERRQALEKFSQGGTLTVDFRDINRGVAMIEAYHNQYPLIGIVAIDDVSGLLAATAARHLGLPGNDPEAVARTGNKHKLRQCLTGAGLAQPQFAIYPTDRDAIRLAATVTYPCILKPLNLSASRGVIRADTEAEFIGAFERIRTILGNLDGGEPANPLQQILVEDYWSGEEVALEGVMTDGQLQVLALFDKPDPLEGPYFEETIYVTPSRHSSEIQQAIIRETRRALSAIGLQEGAVHAELRLSEHGPWLVEVAARSIGGLCARLLEFGAGVKLEEIVLHHALGHPSTQVGTAEPAGVMMIPVPRKGRFMGAPGELEAASVPGIGEITFTTPRGQDVVPLPEAASYLGFIFAKASTPEDVEIALRRAHLKLDVKIE